MKEIYSYLMQLSEAKGKKYKVKLLTTFLQNGKFVKFLQYALDKDRTYHIKGVPKHDIVMSDNISLEDMFAFLDRLNRKGSANSNDKAEAAEIATTNPELATILDRALRKDIRCGVSAKTINSIRPGTIFDVPYQRCSSESKLHRIKYPAIVQCKEDGQFAYGFGAPHQRTGKHFLTRNGSGYDLFNCIERFIPEDKVLVGEMRILKGDGTGYLDRQTSNGLMDKFIEGTWDSSLATFVRYVVWDMLTIKEYGAQKSGRHYEDRWSDLLLFGAENFSCAPIVPVKSQAVESQEEARHFYKLMRQRGEEGAVLKDRRATWGYNTSPFMVKMKNVAEAEFEIVSAYAGEEGKKYAGVMGGLNVKTCDDLLLSAVGSGFSDEERQRGVEWWNNQAGKIVTLKFTEVVTDKTDRKTKSLSNPRFVETRFNEKDKADTIKYCEEQCI